MNSENSPAYQRGWNAFNAGFGPFPFHPHNSRHSSEEQAEYMRGYDAAKKRHAFACGQGETAAAWNTPDSYHDGENEDPL